MTSDVEARLLSVRPWCSNRNLAMIHWLLQGTSQGNWSRHCSVAVDPVKLNNTNLRVGTCAFQLKGFGTFGIDTKHNVPDARHDLYSGI